MIENRVIFSRDTLVSKSKSLYNVTDYKHNATNTLANSCKSKNTQITANTVFQIECYHARLQ